MKKKLATERKRLEDEAKERNPEHVERENFKFRGHIVILGFNETGYNIAEYFRENKQEVFVVDLDYKLHEALKFAYKGLYASQITHHRSHVTHVERADLWWLSYGHGW